MLPAPAHAAEPLLCPQKIAFIGNDAALRRQADDMKALYARIGCPDVAFVGLPGRRGVVAFNTGEVQGELMRLQGVEPEYTRPFLRVARPIVKMTGRLWARSEAQAASGPLGFILGVVWQERQVQQSLGRSTGYPSQVEMLQAFSAGLIDRFLAEDAVVVAAMHEGRLAARPAHAGQPLVSAGLHHYLGIEFAAVAAAVTAELERLGQDDSGTETQ
ncbi:hypothetical protein FNB15_09195 [Ferrovibrio terrae]|uniref:Uncharacterized protein n=1 Tax=Ferrovibrio terrae TaxID=2594003 RepID=A0A516H0W5_9PROT|nr:hypothetical protein [Ferrovibrio terrae]QDO97429.1 hypothetical protein FNB15_09195 [Ferrovibrio terrae]